MLSFLRSFPMKRYPGRKGQRTLNNFFLIFRVLVDLKLAGHKNQAMLPARRNSRSFTLGFSSGFYTVIAKKMKQTHVLPARRVSVLAPWKRCSVSEHCSAESVSSLLITSPFQWLSSLLLVPGGRRLQLLSSFVARVDWEARLHLFPCNVLVLSLISLLASCRSAFACLKNISLHLCCSPFLLSRRCVCHQPAALMTTAGDDVTNVDETPPI